jgi:hypothetical protein
MCHHRRDHAIGEEVVRTKGEHGSRRRDVCR